MRWLHNHGYAANASFNDLREPHLRKQLLLFTP